MKSYWFQDIIPTFPTTKTLHHRFMQIHSSIHTNWSTSSMINWTTVLERERKENISWKIQILPASHQRLSLPKTHEYEGSPSSASPICRTPFVLEQNRLKSSWKTVRADSGGVLKGNVYTKPPSFSVKQQLNIPLVSGSCNTEIMPNKSRAKPKLCELICFLGACLQKQDLAALICFAAGCETVKKWVPCQKEEWNPKIVCFLQPVIFLVNYVFWGEVLIKKTCLTSWK